MKKMKSAPKKTMPDGSNMPGQFWTGSMSKTGSQKRSSAGFMAKMTSGMGKKSKCSCGG